MKLYKLILVFLICTLCLALFSFAEASNTERRFATDISAGASDPNAEASNTVPEYAEDDPIGAHGPYAEASSIEIEYAEDDSAEASDPNPKASNTERKYAVVISADASDTEIYAAQILSEYLSALDGGNYPIINDVQAFDGFKFCVGATSAYDTSDIAGKAADSYVIAPFHNGLAIYGSGNRGTIYGVFTFLEDFCGYRCFTPESGMVSTSGEMLLPEKKTEYNTFFEYRNTDWRSGWIPLYSVANKLNGDLHGALTHAQGGNISYLGVSCHTLSTVFCSADKYFNRHPDYFALNGGKRVPYQLCLTNENVYRIVLEEVLSLLENSHDPEADLQIISLSQADNTVYCECDTCKALDHANGSHAGSLITFVNRIARAVKEAGYDNVEIDTLAYMHTRKVPSAVVPEDNVIVRLCTFECCFSHPMDDTDCSSNLELIQDLDEWAAICNKTYIWDYTTNFAYTLGIFPDFHVLQRNLQCFYEHGIKGVYEEGNYYVYLCDTEFGDLRTFLIAKLMEDPYCDYEAEMLDFCRYYYGDGGDYIKTIIDEITDHIKGHVTIYSSMTDSFAIDEEEAEKIDRLWAMAENAADSSDALAAIERSKLSWRYVKAVLGLREFSGTLEETRNEREQFYNDLISHGVVMIDEWTGIEQDFSEYELIPVEEWEYAGRYYYLKYDLNGGKDGPPSQWCTTNRIWIPQIIPTREGYRFLGWATVKNAVAAEYYPGGFIYPSSDVILYAVWEEDPGSGSGGTTPFSSYDLYIAGEKVDSQNTNHLQNLNGVVLRNGGKIQYDDSSRTLYLKEVDIIPSGSAGTAISYNPQDDTALTIAVEGTCRLKSRDCGEDSLMALGSWGNLNINLKQGSVLEIEAASCRDTYTNVGIYMDLNRTLTVSGPGTLRVFAGDARSDEGVSISLYALGDIIFEKDCSVSIIADTISSVSIGCWLEEGDMTFKDGSQLQITGGSSGRSYGIHLIRDREYSFNSENWTGNMTVSGSYGAILYNSGINPRISIDPKQIRLTGYDELGEHTAASLNKSAYKCEALLRYKRLLFEGLKNDGKENA